MSNNNFEIPEQLREIAEKNVEHATAAYGQMMDSMVQAMGMWTNSTPSNPAADSLKPLQDTAVRFAKQNSEAGLTLAKEIAAAKDMQTILSLQSQFAQSQMRAYGSQAQELGRLMTEATQSSMKG